MRNFLYIALSVLLAVLFAGCEEQNEAHESYYCIWVSGRVVDGEGNPIQGILAYPEGGSFRGREGYTDHTGKFSAFSQIKPTTSLRIIFEDVDGEYNGGVYSMCEVDVSNKLSAPLTPDERGYSGSCTVEVGDVVMSLQDE